MSLKSDTVWNRRPGLVGLRLRSAMASDLCLVEVDRLALGEGDDRPLGVGAGAEHAGAPVALALALAVERVHLHDLHVEDLLDGVVDLGLRRGLGHLERVDATLGEGVGLLAHDRSDDDVAGVLHDAASSAGWAPPRVTGRSTGIVSGVKTTQSATSTS